LKDTGVDFGSNIRKDVLQLAMKQAKKADLAIVFGSGMKVGPFNTLPSLAKKFVIVNLQPTKYDSKAQFVIPCECDKVLEEVLQLLTIKVQNWIFKEKVVIESEKTGTSTNGIIIRGPSVFEHCSWIIKAFVCCGKEKIEIEEQKDKSFHFTLNPELAEQLYKQKQLVLNLELQLHPSYQQQEHTIPYTLKYAEGAPLEHEIAFELTPDDLSKSAKVDVKLQTNNSPNNVLDAIRNFPGKKFLRTVNNT